MYIMYVLKTLTCTSSICSILKYKCLDSNKLRLWVNVFCYDLNSNPDRQTGLTLPADLPLYYILSKIHLLPHITAVEMSPILACDKQFVMKIMNSILCS